MDDDQLCSDILNYVKNSGGEIPSLTDLPVIWDSMPDDFMREHLLYTYIHLSTEQQKWWAFDGLRNLFRALRLRDEPLPESLLYPLQTWSDEVAAGEIERPRMRASEDDRDYRISHMYSYLAAKGWPRDKVEETIKIALENDENGRAFLDGETVRSVFRKLNISKKVFGNRPVT